MLYQLKALSWGPLFLPSSTEQNTSPFSILPPERDPGDSGLSPRGPTPLSGAQPLDPLGHLPWLLDVGPWQEENSSEPWLFTVRRVFVS